ncbi:hypothetical protein AB1N83_008043 [Pleurotus pulmonarius]
MPLPPEILRIIFAATIDDKATSCNLLISSRQFCELVEPALYTCIVFKPWSSRLSTLSWLQVFLHALDVSNGRRAAYVRVLTFLGFSDDRSERALFDKVLAKTGNLRSLNLYCSLARHSFHQSPVFTLTSLRVSSILLHEDQDALAFLESQTSLQKLHLFTHTPNFENELEFSSALFPNLKALFVHNSFVMPFLRIARRVDCLCIAGNAYLPNSSPENTTHMDSIQMSSCLRIRTLSCVCLFRAEAAISVASLFPNLEWLSGPFRKANPDDLYTCNRNLRGILLIRQSTGFSQDEANQFFNAMPSLQFVEYSTSFDKSHRWYRGAAASTPVRWLCEHDDKWSADWVDDVVAEH